MLSNSAFNALLKTLEEPPPHVKFIFATTDPHKLPATVQSRCQRYDFRRIPLRQVVGAPAPDRRRRQGRRSAIGRCSRSRARAKAACATRSRCSTRCSPVPEDVRRRCRDARYAGPRRSRRHRGLADAVIDRDPARVLDAARRRLPARRRPAPLHPRPARALPQPRGREGEQRRAAARRRRRRGDGVARPGAAHYRRRLRSRLPHPARGRRRSGADAVSEAGPGDGADQVGDPARAAAGGRSAAAPRRPRSAAARRDGGAIRGRAPHRRTTPGRRRTGAGDRRCERRRLQGRLRRPRPRRRPPRRSPAALGGIPRLRPHRAADARAPSRQVHGAPARRARRDAGGAARLPLRLPVAARSSVAHRGARGTVLWAAAARAGGSRRGRQRQRAGRGAARQHAPS